MLNKSLIASRPYNFTGCGFIQGSAADIIKIAMINIYSAIAEDVDTATSSSSTETRFHMLKGRCRILLQVSFRPFFNLCSVSFHVFSIVVPSGSKSFHIVYSVL